jgi:hypothetical protein
MEAAILPNNCNCDNKDEDDNVPGRVFHMAGRPGVGGIQEHPGLSSSTTAQQSLQVGDGTGLG